MKYILTIVTAVFALNAQAQQTDFSGIWLLKNRTTILGIDYINGSPKQMTITQKGTNIIIDKITAAGQAPDINSTDIPGTKEKPFQTTTPSGRKKLIRMEWDADGKGFTEISDFYSADDNTKLEMTYTDTIKMEDEKLIFDRKAVNLSNGETWESKSIYEKQ
jgi:hypothetical protein